MIDVDAILKETEEKYPWLVVDVRTFEDRPVTDQSLASHVEDYRNEAAIFSNYFGWIGDPRRMHHDYLETARESDMAEDTRAWHGLELFSEQPYAFGQLSPRAWKFIEDLDTLAHVVNDLVPRFKTGEAGREETEDAVSRWNAMTVIAYPADSAGPFGKPREDMMDDIARIVANYVPGKGIITEPGYGHLIPEHLRPKLGR